MVLILKKSSFQKKSRTQFVIVITHFVVSAWNLMFLPGGDMGGEIKVCLIPLDPTDFHPVCGISP